MVRRECITLGQFYVTPSVMPTSNDIFARLPESYFRQLVADSTSVSQVFDKLDLCKSGAQYRGFYRRVKELAINLDHFSRRCGVFPASLADHLVFAENSSVSMSTLKRAFRAVSVYCCAKCGNRGVWQDHSLTLQLDHANGNRRDNRKENLRWLCPNCHSQTPTYAGRRLRKHYVCTRCGRHRSKHSHVCLTCSRSTCRVSWPDVDTLKGLVWSKPIVALAADLGASHNGLRKHCARVGITLPPVGYWQRRQHGYSHEQALVPAPQPTRPAARRLHSSDLERARLFAEQGKSNREIGRMLGYAHTTIARALAV